MSSQDLSKIKGQTPVSVIVHGGNHISYLLAKTLLEQGSHVVIIDKYTNTSKQYLVDLKKTGKVSFIDFKGIKSFYEKVARIDYLYYMLGEKAEENQSIEKIDSKDFLLETDYLNLSLSNANKYKAKIALITSLRLNRELSNRVNNQKDGKTKPYSPLELQRYGENYSAEFADKTKANLRIIRLGTVVGKGVNEIRDTVLNNLFYDATQKSQIEINGEGLELHNIIHESDAIYGLLKLTFSDDSKGEVISLCNKNDYTTLSLAYKLLELDVEAKAIKFVEATDTTTILQDMYVSAPNAQGYGWRQNITLEDAIVEQIQAYYEKSDKKWEVDKTKASREYKSKDEISNISKTKLGSFVYSLLSPFRYISNPALLFNNFNLSKLLKTLSFSIILLLLIYFVISPIVGISLGGYLIYQSSKSLQNAFSNLDFITIENSATDISKNILRVEDNFNRVYWIFNITNTNSTYENIDRLIQGTKYASDSTLNLVTSLKPLGEYLKDFEPSISEDSDSNEVNIKDYTQYLESLDSNRYLLKEGIYKMSLAENLISTVQTNTLPKYFQDTVIDYKELIQQTNSTVKPLEDVIEFLPDILGVQERKKYLILLQDESEIRSTGGWIASYAIVAIEGGQIREMFVDDIYNAQATLTLQNKYYKAPESLTKALGEVTYSIPLVNWNPNLEEVLLTSEQFIYDLKKGDSLDGVITLDISLIEKLLDKWGGIEVPGESSLISSDNLYSKVFESSRGESPTQIRNSTFLTDLFNSVLQKIFSSKLDGYMDINQILGTGINEKHITFSFKNSNVQSFTEKKGWYSNIENIFNSTPTSIDWNWGVNKVNQYIKKNHTLNIDIKDEKTIDYTYQIAILNDSKENNYPQGEYINYTRIYIPFNAQLMGIRGFKENKYDIYEQDGFKIIGGWFNIPVKETNILEIEYRLTSESSLPLIKNDTHYELYLDIYKQPGSKDDSYSLSLSYPKDWDLEIYKGLTNIENNLNSRFELSSDKNFFISWIR